MKKGIITYYEFLEALSTIRKFKKQVPLLYNAMEEEVNSISKFVGVDKNTKISRLPLSTRTLNVLKAMDHIGLAEGTTQDLARLSLKELLRTKNAGRRTVDEIKELCLFANLQMNP
ncbi:DNA-directed RNA polymerase subunit alpha C-terminal domain-containing protein [Arenibacter algicola]|uniref:DNA-directed RNA polymerase subunit alpha n=1 Tax=Arenibacter algicola TaxID=616991 RepID=A0A221UTE3_9FLAO|nr:DNA-directed RNA polymerase subunit alpha C-terminal domain-containing protein [Arenibacter algicola]ASO04592.1 DNA-directed RNA polymerase subunit alpha [Arenibacter algicola]